MKKRLWHILNEKKKKHGLSIFLCVGILVVGAGMLTSCSAMKDKTEESSGGQTEMTESKPSQMAGNWQIDFDRTDSTLWGSGALEGNGMEISETGEFSYYIGIGVGGTGQCEEKDGEVVVEVEPYESHSSEKEILVLAYGNDKGNEYILMDWYGEDVYWVRSE